MNVKDYIINQILSNYEHCTIQTVVHNIENPITDFNIKNDIYILNSQGLDIPMTAQLHINSDDNSLVTSKVEYANFKGYKNQVFSGNISVELKNYGNDFIPFQLEFIKITPTERKCKTKTKNCN